MLYLPENLHKEDPMMEHIKTLNIKPNVLTYSTHMTLSFYDGFYL